MTVKELKESISKMQNLFYKLNKIEKEYCKEVKISFYKLNKEHLEKLQKLTEKEYLPLFEERQKRLAHIEQLEKEAAAVPDAEPGEGYKKLIKTIEDDVARGNGQRCWEKLPWIINRAKHYQLVTGIPYQEILDKWLKNMSYWYMNYFQDANQPLIIKSKDFRIFETKEEAKKAFGEKGFRCPACGQISTNPSECNSGHKDKEGKICDWKSYGLFGNLGKGATVFVKDFLKIVEIFMPVEWEEDEKND